MRLKPLFARVLLQREKNEKTAGGIILPGDSAKKYSSTKCRVLEKGPNADESIEVGREYLIGTYAGTWINADGKPVTDPDEVEFYLVQDEDLLCEVADE